MKVKRLFLGIITALAFAIEVHAQSFLTNGLTAYYPFSGNANDASGNGNNGTVNGAVLTTDRFGSTNSAYRFNGSSWIQLPDFVLSLQSTQFTVSAWVLADQGPYTNGATIFHTTPRVGEVGLGTEVSATNMWGFGTKLTDGNFHTIFAPMPTNQWAQVVVVYVQGEYQQLWVNGTLLQTNTVPNDALFTSGFPLNSAIGIYDYTGGPYDGFSGAIDDVRFYDRALASSEVQQLYQIESGGTSFLTNGLTAYYPFNGNANDASGHGNNGTVNGAVLTTNQLGLANSAYRFYGTNWIQLPDSILPLQSTQFTVSAWVLADQGPYTSAVAIFHTTPRTGEFGLGTDTPATNVWGFGVKLTDGNFYGVNTPMFTNEWVQAVTVFVQGQYAELWMNGSLMQSNNLPNLALFTSTFPLNSALGIYDYTGGPYDGFKGAMTDVRIYDTALAPAQIQQLYQYESGGGSPAPPPPPCVQGATATLIITNGFIIGATITESGCGYTQPPPVVISGGGGTGAAATAIVSNGVVTGITITDAGTGYTGTPQIYIYSPVAFQIGLQQIVNPAFTDLLIGTNYQLQVSPDQITWTNEGPPFIATNYVMTSPQFLNVSNWSQFSFRLEIVP